MKVTWGERISARENARRELPALVAAYFAEFEAVLAKNPPPGELHPLRLATKKLRYTLELFRDCCGSAFETDLQRLRKIQQTLGEINDCVATWTLLAKKMPRSYERDRMKNYLDRRAKELAKELR